MNKLNPAYGLVSSRVIAARKLGVPVAEYVERTEHGQAWCRRHKGWVSRSTIYGGGASVNAGVCRACAEVAR